MELAGNSMSICGDRQGGWLGRVNSMYIGLRQERSCRYEEVKESEHGWNIVKGRRVVSDIHYSE